ncbi:hypothetical protein YC2023_084444 [Brassica napus]
MYHNFWIYNPSQNSSDKNVNNSSGLHSMVFRSPPIYPTSPILFFTQYPPKLTLNVTILNIPYKKMHPDVVGEITAVKSTVSDPPEEKNHVMVTIKLDR